MSVLISASVLNSDLADLKNEMKRAEAAGADMLHLDVMDGVFTERITFGDYVIKKLRPHSRLPFDTHLMVADPSKLIPLFAAAGSDIITIHEESNCDVAQCLKAIRSLNVKSGLSVNPQTPVENIFPYIKLCDLVLIMSVKPGAGGQVFMESALEKIRAVRDEADRLALDIMLEVDGGINAATAPKIFAAGANVAVAGSYLFKAADMKAALQQLR